MQDPELEVPFVDDDDHVCPTCGIRYYGDKHNCRGYRLLDKKDMNVNFSVAPDITGNTEVPFIARLGFGFKLLHAGGWEEGY